MCQDLRGRDFIPGPLIYLPGDCGTMLVTICVFALRTSLKINNELFILFLSKTFKQTEHGFSNFKLERGCLRIPYGTLTACSSYRYDILTLPLKL